jgi:hypothetical protein
VVRFRRQTFSSIAQIFPLSEESNRCSNAICLAEFAAENPIKDLPGESVWAESETVTKSETKIRAQKRIIKTPCLKI